MIAPEQIKSQFRNKFEHFLRENTEFKLFMLDVFVEGTAFIVGGYFRDFLFGKESRDLDIIVDLPNSLLLNKIIDSGIHFDINRHLGIKLLLDNFEVDIWSLENNWAFKTKLVKLNPEDKLSSIAKGCFYNFDALVISLPSYNYNIRYYKDFSRNGELDILQENSIYKNLNPTLEANILRAFYIQKITGAKFSENTKEYLLRKIGQLNDNYSSSVTRLLEVKKSYLKYDQILKDIDVMIFINEIEKGVISRNQLFLNF